MSGKISGKNVKNSASQECRSDRRSFLKLAGIGAAGAAVMAASAQSADAALLPEGGSGYSKTEHVQKFYDLARF